MSKKPSPISQSSSRLVATGALAAGTQTVRAEKSGLRDSRPATVKPRKLRVGLIGCGGRGSGAAHDCAQADPSVEIYALGDMWPEKITACRENLKALGNQLNVTDSRCFVGFDAFRQVIQSGVDLVLLCSPPGFRPQHIRAAVEAGKHIFAEKPVSVCPAGVRSVIESAEMAETKGLALVAGTQYRHDSRYQEWVRRLHEGAVGEILAAQCYFNVGGLWMVKRKPEWSDMEYQIRNWYYFTWLSGDFIVEQHVHNLDVMNWVMQAHPTKCLSLGGRQARTGEEYGHIYDHFTTLYEYPRGVKVLSMCRQMDNTTNRLQDRVVGTAGVAVANGLNKPFPEITGQNPWKWEGEAPNPYVQEHKDLIASIREGKPLNEGRQIAESTLTAIMARMSAYTGKEVTWKQAMDSRLNLFPETLQFGPHPVEPVPMPGKTELI